ncbi:hypothetical protein GJ496_003236 [Pomphorhynchus laevis]|nr:hypothetical protein GJ496_003236 [Pomphorhynchus laevis]
MTHEPSSSHDINPDCMNTIVFGINSDMSIAGTSNYVDDDNKYVLLSCIDLLILVIQHQFSLSVFIKISYIYITKITKRGNKSTNVTICIVTAKHSTVIQVVDRFQRHMLDHMLSICRHVHNKDYIKRQSSLQVYKCRNMYSNGKAFNCKLMVTYDHTDPGSNDQSSNAVI